MASPLPENTVVLHVTPGEVFDDRWRIETRVGQGAMGSVFRGTDLQVGRTVAIKILAPEHCRKAKVLARFEREAELMVSLHHPNIVQMMGHGRRGVVPYLVMEYLEGMTLAEVQQRCGGRIPVAETVAMVKRVAAGLTFLHHHELVHRDIKPQNVFLASDGRVTILDLGVVRDQANPGLTRPGAMVGTPYYMSPEQILGQEDVDRRTDVYALAAMTFELLTGRPPFLGANNFEVLYGHKNTPVPDAAGLVRGVPKAVGEVLCRGMAKKRESRPETATEFAADLEGASGLVKIDLGQVFRRVVGRSGSKLTAKAHPAPSPGGSETRVVRKELPPPHAPSAPLAPPAAQAPRPRRASGETPMALSMDVVSVVSLVSAAGGPTGTGAVAGVRAVGIVETTAAAASAADDASSSHATLGDSHDDQTFVGQAPEAPPGATPRGASTTRLFITALSQGRPVAASLFIDRKPFGETPRTLTLLAGRRTLRLEANGFKSIERSVNLVAGATLDLKVELKAR